MQTEPPDRGRAGCREIVSGSFEVPGRELESGGCKRWGDSDGFVPSERHRKVSGKELD